MGKRRRWWPLIALLVAPFLPQAAHAGPYIGDFGWCWKPAKECPRGQYSFLHYWTPRVYQYAHELFPPNVDQFPPGLPVDPSFDQLVSPCRTQPPMPTHPYADPSGYYGRPVLPEEISQKEKE
jgi:hypothetical protein